MDCKDFRTAFSDFTDGRLDELTEVLVIGHMTECAACRRMHAAYRAGSLALRQLPPLRPSPGFGLGLRERLDRERAAARSREMLRPWAALAGALALVAVSASAGWLLLEVEPAPTPASSRVARPHGTSPFIVRFSGDSSLTYPGRFPVIPVSRDTFRRALGGEASVQITVDWMFP